MPLDVEQLAKVNGRRNVSISIEKLAKLQNKTPTKIAHTQFTCGGFECDSQKHFKIQ